MGKHIRFDPDSINDQAEHRDPYADWFEASKRVADNSLPESDNGFSGITLEQILAEESAVSLPDENEDILSEKYDDTLGAFSSAGELPLSPLSPEKTDDSPVIAEKCDQKWIAPAENANGSERPQRKSPGKKVRPVSSRNHNPGKKKNKKNKRKFRKAIRVYIILVLVLILAVCAVLWVLLGRFQKKKDIEAEAEALKAAELAEQRRYEESLRRAPQLAFESWYEQTNGRYWADLWFSHNEDPFESESSVADYMDGLFADAEPYRAVEYTTESPVYVLKTDDQSLAKVYLSGEDLNWAVSQVDLLVEGKESASVSVSSGSKVFCNGVELGSRYAGDTVSSFSYEPLADKLINPMGWVTYSVDGLLFKPELTAVPPEGQSIAQTSQGDFLICLKDGREQAYIDRSVNFVRSYLYYYMSGYNGTWGNLFNALAYLIPGTNAYQTLYDTYNGVIWNTAYTNIDTSSTHADSVVIWAENCYSVDVTYDAKCMLNGQAIDYAAATMRIYYLRGTDGNYYISDFESL